MSDVDVGEYCRQVEDYLTRVNAGHLVRIVGPGFDVVRRWAQEGIPLRIACRGIDHRAERHQAGPARRPLRIEFCDADVRAVYEQWHRAVGLDTRSARDAEQTDSAGSEPAPEQRRPSLSKHLDRALEKLGRVAGRLDLSEQLRDGVAVMLTELGTMRDAAKGARGPERDQYATRLAAMDRELLILARASSGPDLMIAAQREAEQDLSSYRARLSVDAWTKALDGTVDQLLRDRLGLPTLEL